MSDRIGELDIGLLLALDALLERPNVTHAAARLNISQSALSARLTKLRHLMADPLFIPAASGRGMIPTPHAIALQPELSRLLEHIHSFLGTAKHFEPATSRRVFRIAATDNPAAILAPDLIPFVTKRAPQAKIAFTFPDKAKIASQLELGEFDLFIGAAEDAASGLVGRKLFEEEFVTAQRKMHPRGPGAMTIDEFCQLDHLLISTSGGRFEGMIDEALAEIGTRRTVSVSIQSYALAPLVIANSDLICTLPRRFLKRFEQVLDLTSPPLKLAAFSINAFWHPRMRDDPAHAWLREAVMQIAKAAR